MKFKLNWDGLIEQNGRIEGRFGFHIVMADNEKDAVKRAYDFFSKVAFINWDAILENDDFVFVISSDD